MGLRPGKKIDEWFEHTDPTEQGRSSSFLYYMESRLLGDDAWEMVGIVKT